MYMRQHRNKIKRYYDKLGEATNSNEVFDIYGNIFQLYKSFRVDSAVVVAQKRVEISNDLNFKEQALAKMNLADAHIRSGLYFEAFNILNNIQRNSFVKNNPYYYYLYNSCYYYLKRNAVTIEEKQLYNKRLYEYRDTLLSLYNPNSYSYISNYILLLLRDGKANEAKNILDNYCHENKFNIKDQPYLNTSYAKIYKALGDSENYKQSLIYSSIDDIKNASKSYISLQDLAPLLYEEGDIERAFQYIYCSLDDIKWGKVEVCM